MSKSVLVMDTPENCSDCQFCYELDEGIEACCSISDDDKDTSLMKKIDCEYGYCQGKPEWCPLKPLPKKKEEEYWRSKLSLAWIRGWNTCISKITGGEADGEINRKRKKH
jgi:hypothetical protein|nr:MAG TPA: hypothetical protein [Caudoviricetes sp.]